MGYQIASTRCFRCETDVRRRDVRWNVAKGRHCPAAPTIDVTVTYHVPLLVPVTGALYLIDARASLGAAP